MTSLLVRMTVAIFAFQTPAFAQSLDELPPQVGSVASDFVAECQSLGGTPDFIPWEYVQLLPGPAGDVFVVDTARMRCIGGDVGDPRERSGCNNGACYLVILTPQGDRYRVDFNEAVKGWKANNGAITVNRLSGRKRFRIDASGLK